MKTKDKLIEYIKSLPEQDIEKIFSDIAKPDKNKEMSDFLFDMINGTTMKFTGEKEITFYKNDEWVIQQDYKNGRLWIRYYTIWKVFEEKFKLNYDQIRNFIQAWVETNTEWRGLIPVLVV